LKYFGKLFLLIYCIENVEHVPKVCCKCFLTKHQAKLKWTSHVPSMVHICINFMLIHGQTATADLITKTSEKSC